MAKNAETKAPKIIVEINITVVFPPESLANLIAHHSKKPISSRQRDKIMIQTSVRVASQTISQTIKISSKLTQPLTKAANAPRVALKPTFIPKG